MLYRVADSDFAPVTDNKGQQTTAASPTNKGLGIFTHIGFNPQTSGLINFYIDGGLTYKGLIPTRDNDVVGVAVAYGHLSNDHQDNEERSNPGYEIVLEATYQVEVAPWLSLQPVFKM
jgi:porin